MLSAGTYLVEVLCKISCHVRKSCDARMLSRVCSQSQSQWQRCQKATTLANASLAIPMPKQPPAQPTCGPACAFSSTKAAALNNRVEKHVEIFEQILSKFEAIEE